MTIQLRNNTKELRPKIGYRILSFPLSSRSRSNEVRSVIISNPSGIIALSILSDPTLYVKQDELLNAYTHKHQLDENNQKIQNHLNQADQAIKNYLSGSTVNLAHDIKIDWKHLSGTPFQKSVWHAIAEIGYGEIETYKGIAEKIKTTGYRAVGQACGSNPVMLAIPCHRVLASNRSLGGFSSGLAFKATLLDLESIPYRT